MNGNSGDHPGAAESTLVDRVRVLRRRRRTIVVTTVVIAAAAVLYSLAQQSLYRASAIVTVNRQNIAGSIFGTPTDPTQATDPERLIATQALIARSPRVAEIVVDGNAHLKVVGVRAADLTTEQFLSDSAVAGDPTADLLTFSAVNPNPRVAQHLANKYAHSYVVWRRFLDTKPYDAAGRTLDKRARALGCTPKSVAAACVELEKSVTQMATLKAVQLGNSTLTTPADSATKVQPLTIRNAIAGVILGVFVGVLLAFAREALDTRVRSEEDISNGLGIPNYRASPNSQTSASHRRQARDDRGPHLARSRGIPDPPDER